MCHKKCDLRQIAQIFENYGKCNIMHHHNADLRVHFTVVLTNWVQKVVVTKQQLRDGNGIKTPA